MVFRHFVVILSLFLVGCAQFSGVRGLAKESSNLVGVPRKALGRRLRIIVEGGTEKQRGGLIASFKSELEDGDLFHLVSAGNDIDTKNSGLLKVTLKNHLSRNFGNWYTDSEGWIVRYDLHAALLDRDGSSVLEGALAGIAYDDDTKKFGPEKIADIDSAAQRDAAVKLSDVLREDVEKKVEKELGKIRPLKLARGVGPLKTAIVAINVERAHPNTRASEIETDMFSALSLAGNELSLVNPQFIEQILDQNNMTNFQGLSLTEKMTKELRRVLPVKLVVLITVRSRIQGVELEGSITELGRESRFLGQVSVRARGVGALRVATVKLARRLLWRIAKTRFVLKDDED